METKTSQSEKDFFEFKVSEFRKDALVAISEAIEKTKEKHGLKNTNLLGLEDIGINYDFDEIDLIYRSKLP